MVIFAFSRECLLFFDDFWCVFICISLSTSKITYMYLLRWRDVFVLVCTVLWTANCIVAMHRDYVHTKLMAFSQGQWWPRFSSRNDGVICCISWCYEIWGVYLCVLIYLIYIYITFIYLVCNISYVSRHSMVPPRRPIQPQRPDRCAVSHRLLVKLQSDEAAVDSMSIVAQTWGCQVFFEGTE